MSTGRPRWSRGVAGSSSEERMIRRGSPPLAGSWMYGTVLRARSIAMYDGGYT